MISMAIARLAILFGVFGDTLTHRKAIYKSTYTSMYGHTEDAVGKATKSIHRFPDANADADDNDSSVRLSRNHLEGGWLAD